MSKQDENLPVNSEEEEPDQDSIITLITDDGEEVDFEFLDLIEYSTQSYAVLSPLDDPDTAVIFLVENPDSEVNTFIMVEDEQLAETIFELFKVKNPELYED